MRDATNARSTAPTSPTDPVIQRTTAAQRQVARRLLIELLIVVVLLITLCIYEFAVEPTQRGFFCDDESIRYPFSANTVTPVMLGLLTGLLPLCIFVLVEHIRFVRAGEMSATVELFGCRIYAVYVELIRQCTYFNFGLLLTLDATEVGKYTIGRLRPHFIAVCQPQMNDGSLCSDPVNLHRYVEEYKCAAEGYHIADVRQARLSFPSGHSSIAFYTLFYMALYLQKNFIWRSSKLARHFLQFLLLMLAWYTALSRVMDNWHHWSDVLAGSLMGVAGALLTAHYIAKLFKSPFHDDLRSGGLRREDTSATLQEEVCPSTPPPYCMNGGFGADQYCTKV